MVDPGKGDPGVCGGQVEVYIEPIIPKPTLLIIGAGHVGKALAYLGKWLKMRIVISDDRSEYCNSENIPNADELSPSRYGKYSDKVPNRPIHIYHPYHTGIGC